MSKQKRDDYLRQTVGRYQAVKKKWPNLWTPQAQAMLENLTAALKGEK